MEDDIIKEFFNESRGHLATIEADLLAIEEAGENPCDELVNKVFRAAHSIKGGSGFFGLVKINELAHKAETVLDMLRSGQIKANAEVTKVLLVAFDQLREMINHPAEREGADISELVVGLIKLASSYLPAAAKASLTQYVSLPGAVGTEPVILPQMDFERALRNGQCVYEVRYDLIHDIDRKGMNILKIFREVEDCGEILDCRTDFTGVGTLESPIGNQLPLVMIYASTVARQIIHEVLLVDAGQVVLLFDPAVEHKTAAG